MTLIAVLGFAFLAFLLQPVSSSDLGAGVLWTIIILGILTGAVFIGLWHRQEMRKRAALRALEVADIATMSGRDFERYVGAILQSRGHFVQYTKTVGDYGVDIIAKKESIATAVQVKRYSHVLGQAAIREAVAGMMHYKCSKSMVVTNSSFTRHAKTLAASNRCELIDGLKLGEWMLEFQGKLPK